MRRTYRNPRISVADAIDVAVDVSLEAGYEGTAQILKTVPHIKEDLSDDKISAINSILASVVNSNWRDIEDFSYYKNPNRSVADAIDIGVATAIESGYNGTAQIIATIPFVKENISEPKLMAINALLAAIVNDNWNDIEDIVNKYEQEDQDSYDNIAYAIAEELIERYGNEVYRKKTALTTAAKDLIIKLQESGYPKISIAKAKRKLESAIYALM